MSSLGDLLLKNNNNNSCKKDDEQNSSQSNDDSTSEQKVFPLIRVERDPNADETKSNASSTDDYVRELLDPDDRPRNVWHVVEGPKVDQQEGEEEPQEQGEQQHEEPTRDIIDKESPPEGEKETGESTVDRVPTESEQKSPAVDEKMATDDPVLDAERHESGRSERSKRSRSPSRRHRHHDRDRDRDRDRSDKDRDRSRSRGHDKRRDDRNDYDRDRYRSRRRHDYSDDDEDDRSRRSYRNRRSRSRSKTSSRRRDRSRSNSQSPITKRNSRTILIMQLSPRVTSRDLEDFFTDIGKVREVRLIMDSKTRRHKGIAYIEFEDAPSAIKAFALNGQKFMGAPLVIQSAQVERNRPPSGDWHSSSSTSHQIANHPSSHPSSRSYHLPPNSYRIYVGGLNVNLTEDMLRSVFEPFGPIIRLELMRDRVTNVPRGYAFITYADIEDGQLAVQSLDGFELAGKSLRVSKSTDKSERLPPGSVDTADGFPSRGGGGSGGGGGHHRDDDSNGRPSRSRDVTASLYELAGH